MNISSKSRLNPRWTHRQLSQIKGKKWTSKRKSSHVWASAPTPELCSLLRKSSCPCRLIAPALSLTLHSTESYLCVFLTTQPSCSFPAGFSSHFLESLKSLSNCFDFDTKLSISSLAFDLNFRLIKGFLDDSIWMPHSHLKVSVAKSWMLLHLHSNSNFFPQSPF